MDSRNPLATNILDTFGLQNAPPEEQDKFLDMAGEAVLTSLVKRIKNQLAEDRREEFFRLFEGPSSDEEKTAFFKTHVSNFKELLLEEVGRFKKEAMQDSQKHRG
jgi:16S rRNA C967 or C1407 C5-methylase (RsmB/RsmF family)